MGLIALNIGCGRTALRGYENLDIQEYPEIRGRVNLCDVRQGLPYGDQTVFLVRAYQFLEHLELAELPGFLTECLRVLAPGGELWCEFPDIHEAARMAAEGRLDGEMREHGIGPIPGIPAGLQVLNVDAHGEPWGHRCVLTAELVAQMIAGLGFEVTWIGTYGPNGLVTGRRPC
jgi:hypothetical protein